MGEQERLAPLSKPAVAAAVVAETRPRTPPPKNALVVGAEGEARRTTGPPPEPRRAPASAPAAGVAGAAYCLRRPAKTSPEGAAAVAEASPQ